MWGGINNTGSNCNVDIRIEWVGEWTYGELLQQYDPSLHETLKSISTDLLGNKIFLFSATMQPQNLGWKLWKNVTEIMAFLKNIQPQILQMQKSNGRMLQNGGDIVQMHKKLQSNIVGLSSLDKTAITKLTLFLNMLACNGYMTKSQQFLLFIEHCVPMDKWNMKIYKHLVVYRNQTMVSKFTGFFNNRPSEEKDKDFFITVTSDGILKSDSHLLESRIKLMIPFTNQLTIECKQTPQKHLTFVIQACAHEQLVINFFGDYINVINFMVALKMALTQSSYSDPNHRFNSYSPVRENCAVKLYNDGKDYYKDIYDCLSKAKWQVCITGWMITPYFLLVRPNKISNQQYRLDGVLKSLAERGVKIYIVAFMQPKMFVNNDSQHVQVYLESLHDNIKVYRHPNNAIPLLWSHHEKMVIIDQEIGFMGGLDICYGRWDDAEHRLQDPGDLWDGAQYNNYRIRDITHPRDYKKSNLEFGKEPRMPWHDIALQFRGDVVLDLLRHFVQYWYFVKSELNIDPIKTLGFLRKRYEQAFYNSKSNTNREQIQFYLTEIKKRDEVVNLGQKIKYMFNGREERFAELLIQQNPGKKMGSQRLQMCRSASEWSIGVRPLQHESSIHQAYIGLIQKAEKFIYIENQFFMGYENRIVECLAKKIESAFRNGKVFKLIVVMPLLPGFEGNISDPNSTVLRIQVHHEYQAILRGQNSLFKRLHFIPNLNDFVYFFGLRKCEVVNNTPMTQIVYVHSKLMIVDDIRAIVGSANINDRSLLGTRDSELACVIEDNEGCIQDLRIRLFAQHFGINKEETKNITSSQVWNKVIANSKKATQFYRDVFGCPPDDFITCGQQVDKLSSKADKKKFSQLFKQKKNLHDQRGGQQVFPVGHAVDFPLQFMKDEDLRFKFGQKQFFAPEMSFT